jgi:hypothetical protein
VLEDSLAVNDALVAGIKTVYTELTVHHAFICYRSCVETAGNYSFGVAKLPIVFPSYKVVTPRPLRRGL